MEIRSLSEFVQERGGQGERERVTKRERREKDRPGVRLRGVRLRRERKGRLEKQQCSNKGRREILGEQAETKGEQCRGWREEETRGNRNPGPGMKGKASCRGCVGVS